MHTWKLSLLVKKPNPGNSFHRVFASLLYVLYLCILFVHMSLHPIILSFWQKHISTFFVYRDDFQIFYSRCQFLNKIIIFYHPYNVLRQFFYDRGALHGTACNSFSNVEKKFFLKCCYICDSEDTKLLQSSTTCTYNGEIGLSICRCRRYIYTRKVFFLRP